MVAPDRGDVIWIDLDPQVGREQAGRRPALVLSPAAYTLRSGLLIICPITNKTKGYPFEVAIPAGLLVSGVVLCDHVKSLDFSLRNAAPMTQLPLAVVDDVLNKLAALLT